MGTCLGDGEEKAGGIQSFEVHRLAATAATLTCQHQAAPVRQDVTKEIAQHPCKGHLHPGLPLFFPRSHHSSRMRAGPQSQLPRSTKFTQCILAFKWDLQHVCWFYTSGSGRAAAAMTPDRKYRLRCFRAPKPPSASGAHKPPGSSNYDILTHNKQYLTPGETSLIFNLA